MRKLVVQARDLPRGIAEADHFMEADPEVPREMLQIVREQANRHTTNMEAAVNHLREAISTKQAH